MLYFMANGTVYFSEDGDWFTGDSGSLVLRLPAAKTLLLELGDKEYKARKLSGAWGKPAHFDIPYTAIAAMQNITDSNLLTEFRAKLSDIILASGIN